MRNEIQTKLFIENFEKVCKELFSYFHSDLFTKIDLKAEQNYFNPNEEQKRMAQMNISLGNVELTYKDTPSFFSDYARTEIRKKINTKNQIDFSPPFIISRKFGQKIQKIANLQYYKSKANYGTKKKGISR